MLVRGVAHLSLARLLETLESMDIKPVPIKKATRSDLVVVQGIDNLLAAAKLNKAPRFLVVETLAGLTGVGIVPLGLRQLHGTTYVRQDFKHDLADFISDRNPTPTVPKPRNPFREFKSILAKRERAAEKTKP